MTKEIKFIAIEPEHLELIRGWRNSFEISKNMYTSDEISKVQQIEWYEKLKNDKSCSFWMVQYNDADLLGFGGISRIDKEKRKCFAAFYIGEVESWGKGIGAKIEFNGVSEIFDNYDMDVIYAEVMSFNTKVLKMHEKFGFIVEEQLRKTVTKNQEVHDVVVLSLKKDDWNQRRELIRSIIYG